MPATFRAALAGQRFPGIIVYRSFRLPALDASGVDRMDEMASRLEQLDEFSEERETLQSLFSDAVQLPFDPEGRVVLPQHLAEHAAIADTAAFVGLGRNFQIWEPGRFAEHQAAMRERARRQQTRLPPLAPAVRRPE